MTMNIRKNKMTRAQSGQSIVETVLMMPVLLLFLLNAINFGYFFFVATNLAAAPRAGVEYSIMGGATPAAIELPAAGPSTGTLTTSFLTYEDMRGAVTAPTTNGAIQVCSQENGMTGAGTASAAAVCTSYGTTPSGHSFPAVGVDPELKADNSAPAFVLHQVDVIYKFTPLIPGTPFNIIMLASPLCTGGGTSVSCVFHRQAVMRGMN